MLTVRNPRLVVMPRRDASRHESLKSACGLSLWAIAVLCVALLGQSTTAGFDIGALVGGLL